MNRSSLFLTVLFLDLIGLAWSAVCGYLLGAGGMCRVSAGTLVENAGMLGIMGRAGMVGDGRRIRHDLLEDREVDSVQLALFGDELGGGDRSRPAIRSRHID